MKQIFFPLIFLLKLASAQTYQIILGPDEIAENQTWTITITVHNEKIREHDNFPEIAGFRKGGLSTSSQTSIINGQMNSSYSLIMTYVPIKQGLITIPPFTMKINGQPVSSPGKKVKIGPPATARSHDPFKDFFDRDEFLNPFRGRAPVEFVDVKEDAFLALTTSKDEVYVGEGFNAVLAFYVAEDNQAAMDWYDINRQFTEILKKLKPKNCWEENFGIESIEGRSVEINKKAYTQFKIYQATYYPLAAEPVEFPEIALEMIKYKIAKNPSFFSPNRQRDFKTFYSKPKTVRVKELPPHPLRNIAAVGNYRLKESVKPQETRTGQSIQYEFTIYGEGNIGAITKPNVRDQRVFDVFDPNIRQNIRRDNNRVTGSATFSYYLIPKEPGTFNLGDYFQWFFFNPETGKYDTLRATTVVTVTGESLKNEAIESSGESSFYDRMLSADNTLRNKSWFDENIWMINLFVLALIGLSVYAVFIRK
ncbi:MAG: BatD family protein [Cyclobacteriaceae bacterium]|nr:BatD family protein [Cyclobacteriaceae bacterium]MCX7637168.1 BatD family protein [Cyclobacteriaceae bacterium]MDW8330345.1 BatD family protein [Cyclobacteriaceae bacterium]